MTAPFTAVDYHASLELAAAMLALVILLSSLDDLFIDVWYWSRRVLRWWSLHRGGQLQPLTAELLRGRAEQPIAIMVPAWKESDVIAAMVENMVQVLDYQHYVVFIGTYVNDPDTIDEVERMCRRYRQVRHVQVPHPGPTCKADCLNCVVDAIFAYEQEKRITFAGVVLHDSEDVLHPLELRFFNYLLPRKDMIQLPVASLERGLGEWVAGTYMDEFAESHGKEMLVRESVAGTVPSAGVGTCFSRRALLALIGEEGNHPFNICSLTEDYDVGMRLQALGMQSIFGIFPVGYKVRRKAWPGGEQELELTAPLSVREYFPDNFRAAYRQKSRWVLGIGLQGWHQIPWRGRSAKARYFLLHDRKGVVTSFISIVAYLLLLQFVVLEAGAAAHWWSQGEGRLFAPGSPWTALIWVNAAFLALRASQRMYFTSRLYGWRHGLMSLPRMVIGNFVNCAAVARAWRLYLGSLLFGKKLAWDKTAHDFPDSHQLGRDRQRLGELLQTWQAVDALRLEEALQEQQANPSPLGQLLVGRGWLDEDTLAEAIAYQADLPRALLTPELATQHAGGLPEEMARLHRAVLLGADGEGRPLVAVATPLDDEAVVAFAQQLGAQPLQRIARDSDIHAALDAAYPSFGFALRVEPAVAATAQPEHHPRVADLLHEGGVKLLEVIERAVQPYPGRGAAPLSAA